MNQCASPERIPRGWSPAALTRVWAGRGRAQRPSCRGQNGDPVRLGKGDSWLVRTRSWLLCPPGDSPGTPVADRSGVDPGGVQLSRAAHDEVAARGYLGTHEQAEYGTRGCGVLDPHPAQHAVAGIHGGLRELAGVHLAQALVPLHRLFPALPLALQLKQDAPQLAVGVGVGVLLLALPRV